MLMCMMTARPGPGAKDSLLGDERVLNLAASRDVLAGPGSRFCARPRVCSHAHVNDEADVA